MKPTYLLLAALLGAACLNAPVSFAQAPLREAPATAGDDHDHQEIDPKILIKAKAAHTLLQQTSPPLVVDVRSRPEFNAEHIQGAISYPYATIKMTGEYPFAKNRKLLLYCGCPHHLSGLSAEILKQKGYADVHVIDEGYWGWKAQGLPIFRNPNAPAQTSMSFRGKVMQAGLPVAFKDIFLLHPATGQLEATRTDREGKFAMHLHFGGVDAKDPVLLQMNERTLRQVALGELRDSDLTLELDTTVASQP